MPSLLETLLGGVVLDANLRAHDAKRKTAPFPDLLGRGPWQVRLPKNSEEPPHVDFLKRQMVVPMGVTPAHRCIRVHEMGHVKFTDFEEVAREYAKGTLDLMVMQSVEDCRIEFLLALDAALKKTLSRGGAAQFDMRRLRRNVKGVGVTLRYWMHCEESYRKKAEKNPPPSGLVYRERAEMYRQMQEDFLAGAAKGLILLGVCRASTNPKVTAKMMEALHDLTDEHWPGFADLCEAKCQEVYAIVQRPDATTADMLRATRLLQDFLGREIERPPAAAPAPSPAAGTPMLPMPAGEGGESDAEQPEQQEVESQPAVSVGKKVTDMDRKNIRQEGTREVIGRSLTAKANNLESQLADAKKKPAEAPKPSEEGKKAPAAGLVGSSRSGAAGLIGTGTPLLGIEELRREWAAAGPLDHRLEWEAPSSDSLIGREASFKKMQVLTPLLTRKAPAAEGKRRRAVMRGGALRNINRAKMDEKPFRLTVKGKKRIGAILLDISGSMSVSESQLLRALDQCPQAVIAVYSGRSAQGHLMVVAKDGKVLANPMSVARSTYRMGDDNTCDGPALEWLAKEARKRKGVPIWVSDGIACHPYLRTEDCIRDCMRLQVLHRIHRIGSFEQLLSEYNPRKLRW